MTEQPATPMTPAHLRVEVFTRLPDRIARRSQGKLICRSVAGYGADFEAIADAERRIRFRLPASFTLAFYQYETCNGR